MKRKTSLLFIFLLMFMLAFSNTLAYASAFSDNSNSSSASSKITTKTVNLKNKKTITTYVIKGQKIKFNITGKKYKWTSSKKSLATVSSIGTVTTKSKGTVYITAKYNSKWYKCKIIIETPKLSKASLSLGKGKSYQLKMSGTKQKVSWKSSNSKIVTVTSSGKVSAKNYGSCTVTATVSSKKYNCKVTVPKPVVPARGTRENPLYAYAVNTIPLYYFDTKLGTLSYQLKKCVSGSDAEKILGDGIDGVIIPNGYTWVYMEFSVKYQQGIRELSSFDVLWYDDFYNYNSTSSADDARYGFCIDQPVRNIVDVNIYPGANIDFYIAFATPMYNLPLTYRLQTGYDTSKREKTYTWFTTKR